MVAHAFCHITRHERLGLKRTDPSTVDIGSPHNAYRVTPFFLFLVLSLLCSSPAWSGPPYKRQTLVFTLLLYFSLSSLLFSYITVHFQSQTILTGSPSKAIAHKSKQPFTPQHSLLLPSSFIHSFLLLPPSSLLLRVAPFMAISDFAPCCSSQVTSNWASILAPTLA